MFGMGNLDLLNKALGTDSQTGANLVPQIIDPYIAELAMQVAPLRTLIPAMDWGSATYDKNRRTALGTGHFVGDNMLAAEGNSTITRFQEPLKIIQNKGAVTGFLQAGSEQYIDSLQKETQGAMMGAAYEEEFGLVYGNRSADSYQFNGMDTWIETNLNNSGYGNPITQKLLDDRIDEIRRRTGNPGLIVMSHKMQSRFGRYLSSNQLRYTTVEIDGGVILNTYKNIPIYPTSFIGGNVAWPGSTVTASASAGTGLTDATTYYYRVAAVMQTGETIACGEVNATTANPNQRITLSWTAPSGEVRLYKIFRSLTTATETLYTIIPGQTYVVASDLVGSLAITKVTTWIDTGSLTTQTTSTVTVTGAAYAPGTNAAAQKPLETDLEDIYIISTQAPGAEGGQASYRPTLKPMGYLPLAKIADKDWFLILQYSTFVMIEQFSAKLRAVSSAGE